jgi:2-methylisocitrate lyase-like PEP mutase family enzyme
VSETRKRLRLLLNRPGLVVAPGAATALYARIIERAGFEVVFTTGAGIANTLLGVPDIGLTTMTEIVAATRNIVDAVSLPVIADCDTGYGNHVNVLRTVREMERAGVASLFIEDQISPKRCGHFANKSVVPTHTMVEKIVAATRARQDSDLVLIARTDAIAVEGFEAAIQRARAYVAAGADMIFVEAPRTTGELAQIPHLVGAPCIVNLVEGGVTPLVANDELAQMGYKVVLYANVALRVGVYAVEQAMRTLLAEGSSQSLLDQMATWQERQEAVGLEQWETLDGQIVDAAEQVLRGTVH